VVRRAASPAPSLVVQRSLRRPVLGESLVVGRARRGEAPRQVSMQALRHARAGAADAREARERSRIQSGDAGMARRA
jgi:hypothetical protein